MSPPAREVSVLGPTPAAMLQTLPLGNNCTCQKCQNPKMSESVGPSWHSCHNYKLATSSDIFEPGENPEFGHEIGGFGHTEWLLFAWLGLAMFINVQPRPAGYKNAKSRIVGRGHHNIPPPPLGISLLQARPTSSIHRVMSNFTIRSKHVVFYGASRSYFFFLWFSNFRSYSIAIQSYLIIRSFLYFIYKRIHLICI